jgi:omega-6 fatty acid desaturase (delta-12 desaturase)
MVVAAGLLVRVFIFFHDCCHGSFFASRRANRIFAYVTGVLTFTPFEAWWQPHARHHATAGNLDKRGKGDIWTLTVEEYEAATPRVRFAYRLFRNPLILFALGPVVLFILGYRIPGKGATQEARRSVLLTNLALLAILGISSVTIGLHTYLLIQLPVMALTGAMGIWLFYVQHQFEDVYWSRNESWDPFRAALQGSSYYKLPRVLQWFSGNIGLHHVHHLRPRIPNYNLQACHDAIPALQEVPTITLGASVKLVFLTLWDESSQTLLGFRRRARPSA